MRGRRGEEKRKTTLQLSGNLRSGLTGEGKSERDCLQRGAIRRRLLVAGEESPEQRRRVSCYRDGVRLLKKVQFVVYRPIDAQFSDLKIGIFVNT